MFIAVIISVAGCSGAFINPLRKGFIFMANYYCKYCGRKFSSIRSLTSESCARHPDGSNKGKHVLYEGSEKSEYFCTYCGRKFSSLRSLTSETCSRHPDGRSKGRHNPAL